MAEDLDWSTQMLEPMGFRKKWNQREEKVKSSFEVIQVFVSKLKTKEVSI